MALSTADAYLEALLARDATAAREAVEDALAAGTAIEDVYLEVLQPALYEFGRRWALAESTVADEHFATSITQSILGGLRARMAMPPKDGRLAVVTCSPDELHSLGVQVVADLLETDGWEVIPLGAATPVADLVTLVDAERPDLVALSTTTAGRVAGVADALGRLRELRPRPLLVVGGQLWSAAGELEARRFGADDVVSDARALIDWLRERCPPPVPDAD